MYALARRAQALLQQDDARGDEDAPSSRRRRPVPAREQGAHKARKPTSWTWIMAQLLDVLRQYPGGLTDSVILTELLERRMRKQGKTDCTDGDARPSQQPTPADGGVASSRGKLLGAVTVRDIAKGRSNAAGGQPAAGVVTLVDCLAPPCGPGPPFETRGGTWLLHVAEEDPCSSGSGAAGIGAAVPMYLHSRLRLLVQGRLPLLAAGRRVRFAAPPLRTGSIAAGEPQASRLLPSRVVVPELPAGLLLGGWPHFDALPYGGYDPVPLDEAAKGAQAQLAPGTRVEFNRWIVARVAPATAAATAAAAAEANRHPGVVRLCGPSAGGSNGPVCDLLLLGAESHALADLLLPGEAIAIYQPAVRVDAPAAAAAAAGGAHAAQPLPPTVSYEYTDNSIVALLPGGWSGAGAGSGAGEQQQQQGQALVAACDHRGIGAGSDQHQSAGGGAGSSTPLLFAEGLAALTAVHRPAAGEAGGDSASIIGSGRLAAAAAAPTAVVARVEALLSYTYRAGTGRGGCLRARLADGTGCSTIQMRLATNSQVLTHMREGHTVLIVGAAPNAASSSTQNGDGSAAIAPPPALVWEEAASGSDVQSMTALPAQLTTPCLAAYTSLAAVQLAVQLNCPQQQQQQQQRQQQQQHAEVRGWPALLVSALAEATQRLADPQPSWSADAPFLQRLCGGPGAGAALSCSAATGAAAPSCGSGTPCAPDACCEALACVVLVVGADVATRRAHRFCGRPVQRSSTMMDLDGLYDDDDDRGGGGEAGASGGGAPTAAPSAASAAGSSAPVQPATVQDTPSKDQSMEGLWECSFCNMDVVGPDVEWQYHGTLTLADVPSGPACSREEPQRPPSGQCSSGQCSGIAQVAGAASAAAQQGTTATLLADSAALQGLLGVSAEAFHAQPTARRRRAIEARLALGKGGRRRAIVGLYPRPNIGNASGTALRFNSSAALREGAACACGGCDAGKQWAVAQLHWAA